MREPQILQKWFVIVLSRWLVSLNRHWGLEGVLRVALGAQEWTGWVYFPDSMVLEVAKVVTSPRPEMYLSVSSFMMKFEANWEAVSLRQSVQLQRNWMGERSQRGGCDLDAVWGLDLPCRRGCRRRGTGRVVVSGKFGMAGVTEGRGIRIRA